MTCQRCKSERVAQIVAKHSDMFWFSCPADEVEVKSDYAPRVQNVCGGDYTRFKVCLDCGQVQGTFPVKVEKR